MGLIMIYLLNINLYKMQNPSKIKNYNYIFSSTKYGFSIRSIRLSFETTFDRYHKFTIIVLFNLENIRRINLITTLKKEYYIHPILNSRVYFYNWCNRNQDISP